MLFTEANMDVVYDFYGNRSTFEYEFEYEYEYVAVFMDMAMAPMAPPCLRHWLWLTSRLSLPYWFEP